MSSQKIRGKRPALNGERPIDDPARSTQSPFDLCMENAYYAVLFRFRQPPDARRFQFLKETY
jgi:hypothetical protein